MYIKFEPKTLSLIINIGPLEKYTPTKKIRSLHEETQVLKNELNDYIFENWKTKDHKEVDRILNENPEDKQKFQDYLNNQYVPKVKKMIEEVNKLNEKYLVKS